MAWPMNHTLPASNTDLYTCVKCFSLVLSNNMIHLSLAVCKNKTTPVKLCNVMCVVYVLYELWKQ